MTHSTGKQNLDRKVKLVLPENLYGAAVTQADRANQTLEEWLMSLIAQHLQGNDKDPIQPLDWGRIDSRIDQRVVFLERRIDVLAERVMQLSQDQQIQAEQTAQLTDLPGSYQSA